jgi:tetratricopeptide (TPR) repeat protein
LPSLPGLFFKRNHRASHSETTNNCEDPQLDRNTRVLLSPRNHASLLGGFSQVKRETFSSTRVNENDRHSIEVLFSKASKAEFDQNYILSLDLFRKCLKMLYLLKSDPKEEEHEHDLQIASVHHSIGTLYWKMGDYEDSLDSLKEAYSRIKVLMNRYGTTETISLKEQLCDILNTTGKVYSSKGDYKSALNFHEESLSILKAALFGKDYTCSSTGSMQDSTNEIFHPGIVKSLICIGTVHAHCGRLTEAMATLKNGLDIQLKLIGPHHVDMAATLNAIGSVYEKSGRHEKAMQCYKKARQIYLREIGESHVDVAVTMNNIAQIYHHVGKYQKAMETYREALRVMINILGDSHRNVAAIMFNMGLVHVQCCQYSKAFEIFEETLQMQRASLGDFHVDVALTLESMGAIYEQSLKINKALEMYSKALVIRQKTSGDRLFVALTMDKIGKCQMNLNGDIKEALACFEKSIQIYRTCGISDDEPLVWEARQNYDSAVSILRKQKGLPM